MADFINLIKPVTFQKYSHFLKGDVSGIQDFIFTVKSKGASKSLKARSYFIQAIADISIAVIVESIGKQNVEVFYNGGGNFYLFCNADINQLNKIQLNIQEALKKEDLHLFISHVETKKSNNFGELWKLINEKSSEDKLLKNKNFFGAFSPYSKSKYEADSWKIFTKTLTTSNGADIVDSNKQFSVDDNKFSFIKKSLVLGNVSSISFANNIVNKLPLWNENLKKQYNDIKDDDGDPIVVDNIISFGMLARFAKERTGTEKIGVLKLDLDNLGMHFLEIQDYSKIKDLSQKLNKFFSEKVFELWNTKTFSSLKQKSDFNGILIKDSEGNYIKEQIQIPYKDNLYFVFAGGDDCFVIGAWDAVFEFTTLLKVEFDNYIKATRIVTFSAALLLLNPHYPMVQLAEEAEECLDKAKSKRISKDAINVMGEVIDWSNFKSLKEVVTNLQDLIMYHDEPKNILHRIMNSQQYFDRLSQGARNGYLSNPKVWRLKYYMARKKRKEKPQEIMNKIMNDFIQTLLITATNRNALNAKKYEITARWAELLTRKF